MSTFYIASNYITYTGVAGGFGHLQMVYDTGTQLREIEVQAPAIITAGDWSYPSLPRLHNATTTPGFEVFGFYKRVEVDLRPEQTALSVWNLLSQFHESMKIHGANIDYDIYQNSNSYVYTALKVVGIDLSGYISSLSTASYSTFPGQFKDVLQGADVDAIGTIANIPVSLAGTSGADYISTGKGNDTLSGGVGHDTIFGGNGNDSINGGAGNDRLNGGAGNDRIYGGIGNDTIAGGNGRDLIDGGLGADRISGGMGQDTLNAGVDNVSDIFIFTPGSSTTSNPDTILNFNASDDFISLIDYDPRASTPVDDAFIFGAIIPTPHGIWFKYEGGNTVVYGDTTGDTTPDLAIVLQGIHLLTSDNFFL